MPQTPTGHDGRDSPGALRKSEPFHSYVEVPVAGGVLTVARAGPPAAGGPVVLALHGMTSCHAAYRTVARELCSDAPICLLAPDLRGRGRSAHLPGPYGIAAHVADLLAVLDRAGAHRAILVGHSMGCDLAARFAADHPERVAAVVLLDGGLPILADTAASDGPDDTDPPGLLDRLEATFTSAEEYVSYWRGHPALKTAWDEDIDAFVRSDFVQDGDGVRCVVKVEAVLTDMANLTFDGLTRTAVTRLSTPVLLLRAERGVRDDDPVIPLPELDEFLARHSHVSVELIPDVNHYTLLMGSGHGPRRVAGTVAELAAGKLPGESVPLD